MRHELVQISDEEKRQDLAAAGYGQSCIERGSINIVIAAVYERTAGKYGVRAARYVHMEVGHATHEYLFAVDSSRTRHCSRRGLRRLQGEKDPDDGYR